MEDGKALAKDVLPFVAIRLQAAAKANGALELALKGLNVKVGQSKATLQIFQDAIFNKGVESGLTFLLDGFRSLMKSGDTLASLLGGVFKGAVVGLVAPFRLVYAAIFDVTKLLGLHDSDGLKAGIEGTAVAISGLVGTVVSLAASLWALKKAWGVMKGIRSLPSKLNGIKGAVKGGGSKVGGGILSGGVQKVFVTNMGSGFGGGGTKGGGVKGNIGKLAGVAASLLSAPVLVAAAVTAGAVYAATNSPYRDSFKESAAHAAKNNVSGYSGGANYQKPPSSYSYGTQKVDVKVNVKHDTPMFRSEVEAISDDRINQSYSTSY